MIAKHLAVAALAASLLSVAEAAPYAGEMVVDVDATDLARRIHRVQITLPVARPGPLTLYHPRWLPGTHSPEGDVNRLAGLQVRAGDRLLPWTRDPLDTHAFRVDVPPGTPALQISFEHLAPTSRNSGGRVTVTPEMLNLQWNQVVLYPAGWPARDITVRPVLRLPEGWTAGTALRAEGGTGPALRFKPVTLETLVDSPVFAGRHFRRIELDDRGVALNLVADSADKLQPSVPQIEAHRELVRQADRLFQSRHFAHYDFLLALSDELSGIGLEHHQSSENAVRPDYWDKWEQRPGARMLLPHEYTHSWNGKFRRPADQFVAHFNTPLQNSLLWLYEGQTEFWGWVLAARSGLLTTAQARDVLARTAAFYDNEAGRRWRNLQDTTNDPLVSYRRGKDWPDWQRTAGDYYREMLLVWLDTDSLIREKTGGQRSMDDFARAFFGVRDGDVGPLPYRFEDVVAALRGVADHDWAAFLRQRLDAAGAPAPLDGLARSGWKLVYTETPNDSMRADEADERVADLSWSLGLVVGTPRGGGMAGPDGDSTISNVRWGGPAFAAGITPGQRVIAVNGVSYRADRLKQAISANKSGEAPIQLLLRDGDRYRTVALDWRGGLRYPRLERIEGTEDRLTALLSRR